MHGMTDFCYICLNLQKVKYQNYNIFYLKLA